MRPASVEPTALELRGPHAAALPVGMGQVELHAQWPLLARLPLRITAAVPLPRFKVSDVLSLRPGEVLESAWESTSDVPLRVGKAMFSFAEFEVVEGRLAVRLTRLA